MNDIVNETQIIANYRTGVFKGLVEAPNCYYFPVRITGTGETYRYDEANKQIYIEDRVKSNFLTRDVLDQCSRLPITLNHPNNSLLDTKSFKDTEIIGQTIDSWIEGEEIWGLARLYDKTLLKKLGKSINSTSPGVLSRVDNSGVPNSAKEDIIEFNHLAFVDRGHWDQKSNIAFRLDKEDSMVASNVEPNIKVDDNENDNTAIPQTQEVKEVEAKGDGVEEDVKDLKNHEKKEAKVFEELAKDHKNIDNSTSKVEETKVSKDSEDEELNSKKGESMAEEVKDKVDEEAIDLPKEEEVVEVDENEVEEVNDEEVETEVVDEEGKEESKTEEKSDEDEEVIEGKEESKLDKERDELLGELRKLCDSAHPSLSVKMPHIQKRETPLSVMNKFCRLNSHILDEKYSGVVKTQLDAMTNGLGKDMISNIKDNIKAKNEKLGKMNNQRGYVDTGLGYSVDQSFLK